MFQITISYQCEFLGRNGNRSGGRYARLVYWFRARQREPVRCDCCYRKYYYLSSLSPLLCKINLLVCVALTLKNETVLFSLSNLARSYCAMLVHSNRRTDG